MLSRWFALCFSASFALGMLYAEPALACAVCGIGEDESTAAFMISTAMLTFTPLTVLGLVGYHVYRRFNPDSPTLLTALKSLFMSEAAESLAKPKLELKPKPKP